MGAVQPAHGRKYSRNGYIRLWIPNSPNEKALNELRNIIEDKTELRKYFEKYSKKTAKTFGSFKILHYLCIIK